MIKNLSPSYTEKDLSTTYIVFSASCSLRPAFCTSCANTRPLPSVTGGSGASILIRQLSTPIAKRAPRRCSTVKTWAPFSLRVVAFSVEVTSSARAWISGCPGRSVRTNTIPVPGFPGCNVMVTSFPECSPIPEYVTSVANVTCFSIYVSSAFYFFEAKRASPSFHRS